MPKKCLCFGRKKPKKSAQINATDLMSSSFIVEDLEENESKISINSKSDEECQIDLQNDAIHLELYERGVVTNSSANRNSIPTKFDLDTLKFFLCQDINRIRGKQRSYDDPYFLKHISSIVENTNSQLFLSLKTRLRTTRNSLEDLNSLIQWLRIKVCFGDFHYIGNFINSYN
jgi:hypothetical protein